MDYKVKTSSKYENIKSVVNSGTTIRDVVYQSNKIKFIFNNNYNIL